MSEPQYQTRRCVIGERPHQASVGHLCLTHFTRLGRILHDIEDGIIDLDTRLSMAISYDIGHHSLASERSPVRVDVLVLLDPRHGTGCTRHDFDETGWDDTPSILETLHAWARLVREERHLTPPQRVTVTGERATLTRALDWCAEQPWIDEMFAELTDVAKRVGRANDTIEVPVGTCESLQPDGKMCDGDVWHVLVKPDGRIERGHHGSAHPDDEPGFRCGACRRVWTGTEAVRKRDALWRAELARKEAG